MRKAVYIGAFPFSAVTAKGQFETRDSLLSLLPLAKEDTSKVRLLLKMADAYETNDQDSAIFYLEESKQYCHPEGRIKSIQVKNDTALNKTFHI